MELRIQGIDATEQRRVWKDAMLVISIVQRGIRMSDDCNAM